MLKIVNFLITIYSKSFIITYDVYFFKIVKTELLFIKNLYYTTYYYLLMVNRIQKNSLQVKTAFVSFYNNFPRKKN